MDRLRLMETFVRVVETGSFSAVAREGLTTQSAVSKQVQALEAQLGAKLLVRSTRSHSLTEAGKLYYERCRQVLDTLEEARIEVHRAEHEISGVLRVAAPVNFGRLHIVPRLPDFYERYPHIRIDLQLDDSFVDLVAAGVDVAFRVGELKDSRLVARRIGTAHRVTLAAPSYLARHGEPKHPQDLVHHQCLIYSGLVNLNEWVFQQKGKPDIAVRVGGNFQSNSSEAIREATCGGLGISYSPQWVYGDDIRAGRVKPILTRYSLPPLPLNVVFQPARRPSLKVNRFVAHFAEAFSRDPDIAEMLTPLDEEGALRQRP
ncbi:LysR family transcriptional regulator [Noviherbaspirillum denitrificans]|uniref:LysR family transcriptional regulator n=1 Tax=Noviherbaspirillum denitrificans TaxID=1968433 RepID=A0A254TB91_9BURK|nr:LysR family transcriptional regulator [Noviherbaspirillum denitrificans]OWW19911.1 LysR family transcriptional regulator [Noviherbaspirillum denitrificans]